MVLKQLDPKQGWILEKYSDIDAELNLDQPILFSMSAAT